MDRRSTLKWIVTASTAMPLLTRARTAKAAAAQRPAGVDSVQNPADGFFGYGTDPDLTKSYRPGDWWPLTLNEQQRKTAAALCDVVIPEDAVSRSASQAGVVDFLDEWVSAPYPAQQQDRPLILDGLRWMDAEAVRRFSKEFADLAEAERRAICDDICSRSKAAAEFAEAANFFARYRDLTAGGFYTSPEGRKDLGYIGNVPLSKFEGPPADLLRKLGLL